MCQNIILFFLHKPWHHSNKVPTLKSYKWKAEKTFAHANTFASPIHVFLQLCIAPTPPYAIWTDAKAPRKRLKCGIGNIKWNQSDEFKFVLFFVSQLFSLSLSPSSLLPSCPIHLHIHLYYLRVAYKWTCKFTNDSPSSTSFSLWHFRLLCQYIHSTRELESVYIDNK